MEAILAFKPKDESTKISLTMLHSLLGSLNSAPRLKQKEVLRWITDNLRRIDLGALRAHYGYLLGRLRAGTSPVGPLVDVIIAATDSSVITQPRVSLIMTLYTQDPRQALARLLKFMRSRCSSNIYIPTLGQSNEYEARFPLRSLSRLEASNIRGLSSVNTRVYKALIGSLADSDLILAKILAQLWVVACESHHVFLAVEQFAYEQAPNIGPLSWSVLSRFLRFWPQDLAHGIVDKRLISPLLHRQNNINLLLRILPELWHLGGSAADLVDATANHPIGIKDLNHVMQFYLVTGLKPSPKLAAKLAQAPGLLSLCARWAADIPEIALTLQGEFCLPCDAPDPVKDLAYGLITDADVVFCLANSPWLGSTAGRTYLRLLTEKGASKSIHQPQWFAPETLSSSGIEYGELCLQLLADLKAGGLDINAFLKSNG